MYHAGQLLGLKESERYFYFYFFESTVVVLKEINGEIMIYVKKKS